jgi:rare lipoprotein A
MRSRASTVLLALALVACSGGSGRVAAASAGAYGTYVTTGLASWYGDELAGNWTASGDRFDPDALTAAHRTLPLGSYAEVSDLDTGRSVVVLINDRGPGRRDREIDLSRAAALRLGFGRRSVTRVKVRAYTPTVLERAALLAGRPVSGGAVLAASNDLSRPVPVLDPSRRYELQVASFSNQARAQALAARLGASVVTVGALYRVRLGPIAARDVQHARDAVAARGYGDAQILPAD